MMLLHSRLQMEWVTVAEGAVNVIQDPFNGGQVGQLTAACWIANLLAGMQRGAAIG